MGWFTSKRKKKDKRRVQHNIKQGRRYQEQQIKQGEREEKRYLEREKKQEAEFAKEKKQFKHAQGKYNKELKHAEKGAKKEAGGRKKYVQKLQKKFNPKDTKFKRLEKLSPEQQKTLSGILGGLNPQGFNPQSNQTYQSGENYLQNLLSESPEAFSKFAEPYKRQFEEEIIPQVAERFTGQGAQKSSAFRQQLAQQATGLQERLATLREGLRMQAVPQAFQYGSQPAELQSRLAALGLGTQTSEYGTQQGRQGHYLGVPEIPTFLPGQPNAPQAPSFYRRNAYTPTFQQPSVSPTGWDRFSQGFASSFGNSLGKTIGSFGQGGGEGGAGKFSGGAPAVL